MKRRGAISLSGIRAALRKCRQPVLLLTAVTTFYGMGGQQVLEAQQQAVAQAHQERNAMLLAAGMPADRLPAPPPSSFEVAGERVAAIADSTVAKLEQWAVAAQGWVAETWSGRQLASAQAGESGPPSRAVASRRATPREVVPPQASDGREHARGRELRTFGSFVKAAGAAASAVAGSPADDVALPLRRVERRALTQEIGALSHDLEPSSAIAPPPSLAAARVTAKSTPAPEIVALAESLGRSPGRIFRFVHDTIEYEPQIGADAPPVGTLWEGRGTAWEQAWLLQDLLRAAGVDARLEWGDVEISPATLQDLTGVADVFRAGDLLTTGGIRVVLLVQGGQVVAARLPHVWVKANLDYAPNRGATPGPGDTWIRMDPTLKRYDEDYGNRTDDNVSFVLGTYLQSGTESSPRTVYEQALLGAGVGNDLEALKPRRSVDAEGFPFVPGTLRAKLVTVAGEAAEIPAAMQQQLQVQVIGEVEGTSLLSWSAPAPQVWGKKLELAWPGATAADQSTIDLYGGIFATPPYEVDLKPSLRVDGVEVALGNVIGSAEDVELRGTITPPAGPGIPTFAVWDMFAGEHGVLLLAFGGTPQQVVDRFAQAQAGGGSPADVEGWGLARAAATYLRSLESDYRHLAALRWHRIAILGAAVFAVQRGAVSTADDGTPVTFAQGPLSVDVGAMPLALVPAEGPLVSTVPTMELLGSQGSVREGEALAAAFGGEHVTAVGFLTRAVRAGQTLTLVDETNVEPALATAELSAEAEGTVRFGVSQGLVAWIPRTQIEIAGWKTTGYILENPTNGAGAYLVTFERKVPIGETNVVFHSPVDLAEVTAPTEVVASIRTDNLQSWSLATKPTGEGATTVIASGTGAVDNRVLGTFDPTMLLNGMHELVLTGTTAGGQILTGRITVVVEGGMKIGNFSVSFMDLSVPLSGLAIEVLRTYDSRGRSTSSDFGHGWTVELRQGSYRNNRKPGDGWQILKGFIPCQNVTETKSHLTTVRLSDREVYRFEPRLSSPGIMGGGCFATAGFRFAAGPAPATLSILGRNQVFWQNGTNTVVDLETQELFEPSTVRLATRDGRVFDFDIARGVTRLADLNGNDVTITPGGVTHSSGQMVTFTRDSSGRITSIEDPDGASLAYAYDGAGDLVAVTDRVGATSHYTYVRDHLLDAIVDSRGVTPVRNEYGADGRLLRHIDAFGKAIELSHDLNANREVVTDRLGHSRVLEYDERGNVVREIDSLGSITSRTFDQADRLLSTTDPLGHTTTYGYDSAGNLTAVTDPLGHTTRHTYDAAGRPLTTTDARGKVSTNVYDAAGNLLTTSSPGSGTTTYTYDAKGNFLSDTDALGGVTTFTHDSFGNVTRQLDALGHETVFVIDGNGRRRSETVVRTLPNGSQQTLTTSFSYDSQGRHTETVSPGGVTTKTIYNSLGQVAERVDPLGRHKVYTYDDLGRLTQTLYPDGTREVNGYDAEGRLIANSDRGQHVTTYLYDEVGRPVKTTFADGTFVTSTYDAAGRVVASTDARGNTTTFEYDAAGRRAAVIDALLARTEFEYDEVGNQVAVTDANRNTTRFVYDEAGRLIRTLMPDGTTKELQYDGLGRRTLQTDQAGRSTRFAYDAGGQLTTVTDALNQVTSYAYDEVGNRISQTDASNHTTRFEYDQLGRLTRHLLPDGSAASMAFDSAGNVSSRTDFGGRTIEYTYDAANRLLTKSYSDGGAVAFTYTAGGRRATMVDARGTTTYSYDQRDRLVEAAQPDGRKLGYAYDSNGNRSALVARAAGEVLTTSYGYDRANRLDTVTDPQGRIYHHAYDAKGNRTAIEYPNQITTNYVYDTLDRLKELRTRSGAGDVVQSHLYTLGAAGNRTMVEEADGTARSYVFDELYRLVGESVERNSAAVYSKAFSYDAVGNRSRETHTDSADVVTTTDATFDTRDRQLSEGGQTWTWDANGNLTSKDGEATYAWDNENRLRQVTLADGSVVTHTYDGDGVRVETETRQPGGAVATIKYLVDGAGPLSHVVAETSGAALAAYYVRGDELLAVMRPGTTAGSWSSRFYHADGLGSIRVLTDESGAVTDRYSFTAFGELLAHQGSDPNAYLFAGEALDANVGFYYLRARWMDPEAGRFASVDPFAGRIFEPATLHKYVYAGNDPVDFVDPTGEEFSLSGTLGSMAIGGIINSIIGAVFSNHTPDTGAFWGEFATNFAIGAATAPVGGLIAKIFGPLIRLTIRPLLGILGRMAPIFMTGTSGITKLLIRISRFFLNTNRQYPRVTQTILGRALKFIFPRVEWEMHHVFIQQAWTRAGGPNQLFLDVAENEGLRRIGNGLWNLLPVPSWLNAALGQSPLVGTPIFATAYYSILAYGPWHAWEFFAEDDGDE